MVQVAEHNGTGMDRCIDMADASAVLRTAVLEYDILLPRYVCSTSFSTIS